MRRRLATVIAVVPLVAAAPAAAAPGDVDTTFGQGGRALAANGLERAFAEGVELAPDGRIYVAGTSDTGRSPGKQFLIARFGTDGALDGGFGQGGLRTKFFSPNDTIGEDLVVQPDGKPVVGGWLGNRSNFMLARFNTDGGDDQPFGGGNTGWASASVEGALAGAEAVARQADGKLLVAGWRMASFSDSDFAVARWNPDGTIDSPFGRSGNGVVSISAGAEDTAYDMVVQPDGKIVLAGYTGPSNAERFAVLRLNPDGSPDASFGPGGGVTTPVGTAGARGYALVRQPDGKLVVAGPAQESGAARFALVRYNADGSLDASFGSGGKVLTPVGTGRAIPNALAQDLAGNLVAGGLVGPAPDSQFALVRYTPTGAVDTGFGNAGVVLTPVGDKNRAYVTDLTVQPDGKLLAAGYAEDGPGAGFGYAGQPKFALVRYLSGAGGTGPGPGPGPDPGPGPGAAPRPALRAASAQRVLRQGGILISADCNPKPCTVAASGSIAIPRARALKLASVRRTLTAGGRVRLRLALPRRARTPLARALRRRARIVATVALTASNPAGRSRPTRSRILVRR